jgi:TRAP-type transport system periplasmic protein
MDGSIMNLILRRAAWAGSGALLAAAVASSGPALSQEIQLKASLFPPPSNPLVKAMEKWAEQLKEKSNGRLTIKVFPASQMGPPPRQFDLVRTGVADIAVVLQGATPGRFPLTELTHLPGVIKGTYGTSLGLSEIAPAVLASEYPGVKIINVLALRTVIIARGEIVNANSLKGKRIRAAGAVQSDVLEALSAVPTLVQPGDLNDALSKGMIEGVSTAYSGIDSYKLDDVAKFIAEGDMGGVTFATLMNEGAYNSLPPDLRRLIDESSGLPSARLFARMLADDEARFRENLLKHGIKITRLADEGVLIQAGDKILDRAIKKAEAKGVAALPALEQMKAAIAKYPDRE